MGSGIYSGQSIMRSIPSLPLRVLCILFLLSIATACGPIVKTFNLKECAPVYGNWCGEKYPLTGHDPRPVDSWDRACRTHDKCYDSGESKRVCDDDFVHQLKSLSFSIPAPQAMHNAHSWFEEDGWVGGHFNLATELWALEADCEGGDGYRARFTCVISPVYGCPYNDPGRAGMPCHCGYYYGFVVEE